VRFVSAWEWTADDSKDLDNRVRAYRKADKIERSASAMAKAEPNRIKTKQTAHKNKEDK
jgi:hypothetical protein